MKSITEFIDKALSEIENEPLFKELFQNAQLEVIENNAYLENLTTGIDIVLTNENVVNSIHLFPNFNLDIPLGLKFNFSKADIEKVLGRPNHTGGGISDLIFGEIPLWSRYRYKNYSIHFQFSKDNKAIDIVTLGSVLNESYFLQNQN